MRLLLLILFLSSFFAKGQFVKFKEQKLYDVYEEPKAFEKIEPIIFDDAAGTMWSSLEDCGDFKITDEVPAVTGKNVIKISWDKGKGCEWIGFGNSFSNWAPTDMSKDRLTKAFSMYARTQTKVAGAIPIVLALEDASFGGSYHFIYADRYLYGLQLDTTWKRIIVPLWHFPIREDEVDIYAIRQMQFQLEGAGSFYLDDLKLIDYSEKEYQQMLAEVEAMKPKGNPNQLVYTEGKLKQDAWGVGDRKCQQLKEETDTTGNTFIKWKFNANNCNWAKWGINWNEWYQSNFRGIIDKSQLKFKVRLNDNTQFKLVLKDFKGHNSTLQSDDFVRPNNNEWVEVSIPLADFKMEEKDFAIDLIREFGFEGEGEGEVHFDDIRIEEIK